MRARFTKTRASAVRPANAATSLSSRRAILRAVRASWSLAADFFSTAGFCFCFCYWLGE